MVCLLNKRPFGVEKEMDPARRRPMSAAGRKCRKLYRHPFTAAGASVPGRDGAKAGLAASRGRRQSIPMRTIFFLASLALLGSPAAAEPLLVANTDGSVTLTAPIDSDAPNLLPRAPRPVRNAGHARMRAEAQAEFDRSFQEAIAQAREAARVPQPR
jgi:hypothetical protein